MWWVLRNLGKNDEDYWWLLGARYIPSKADEWARTLTAGGSTSAGSTTVVAPYWPGQSWFQELEALAAEVIKKMIIKEIDEVRPDGRTKIEYGDGDKEQVVLKEERYRAPPSETTEEQQQQSREEEEEEEEEKPTPWRTALLQHLTGELGDDNQFSETAAEMQAAALQKLQLKNDRVHATNALV
ncbi:hypothetical protein CYMTET_10178 [Cymbomonas tetramitiformis]|uniref:Uncharacterized protein n=1 Tax=Cymbomonas tetramitiformis TaxID=36881 RepID=A0AAE0GR81_9CHLO|nr:hypothetical protein CYMTET_10178 [Cymbomonas tetramitiformis]